MPRQIPRRWFLIWIRSVLVLLLAGCAGKDAILPQKGPTMLDVYDAHFGLPSSSTLETTDDQTGQDQPGRSAGKFSSNPGSRSIKPGDTHLAGFTRTAHDEIRSVFPVLPNPILVLYVFPHLTTQGYPVPGYATAFPMYDKIEYALPGERDGW